MAVSGEGGPRLVVLRREPQCMEAVTNCHQQPPHRSATACDECDCICAGCRWEALVYEGPAVAGAPGLAAVQLEGHKHPPVAVAAGNTIKVCPSVCLPSQAAAATAAAEGHPNHSSQVCRVQHYRHHSIEQMQTAVDVCCWCAAARRVCNLPSCCLRPRGRSCGLQPWMMQQQMPARSCCWQWAQRSHLWHTRQGRSVQALPPQPFVLCFGGVEGASVCYTPNSEEDCQPFRGPSVLHSGWAQLVADVWFTWCCACCAATAVCCCCCCCTGPGTWRL